MPRSSPALPRFCFSTPDSYFDDIGKNTSGVRGPKSDVSYPVVDDDLQHHSVGCYTAVSEIKKDNRTAEAALVTGEKMAAAGERAGGLPLPQERFQRFLEESPLDAVPR